jgi:hypothetical protein
LDLVDLGVVALVGTAALAFELDFELDFDLTVDDLDFDLDVGGGVALLVAALDLIDFGVAVAVAVPVPVPLLLRFTPLLALAGEARGVLSGVFTTFVVGMMLLLLGFYIISIQATEGR